MGCCLSAGKVTAPPVSAATTTQIPPPIEEETVKEVVVQSVSVSVPDIPTAPEQQVSDSEPHLPLSLPTPTPEISLDIKSDISSVTPSHSFSTATTASVLEDDALSKPHRPPPPSSSTSRRNRPQRIPRSPGERYSPQGKLRPRLVRERPSPQPIRRNVDSGQRSGLPNAPPRRRSRSPAAARRSPMKKREEAPVKKEETTKVDVEVKKEEDLTVRDPEVSMECFIFL